MWLTGRWKVDLVRLFLIYCMSRMCIKEMIEYHGNSQYATCSIILSRREHFCSLKRWGGGELSFADCRIKPFSEMFRQ